MKYFLCILFLNHFLFIHSAIPTWDINSISVDLFSSSSSQTTYSYDLYNQNGYVLTKKITKNEDGTLSSKNYLTYNSVTKEVAFEGIESIYYNQLLSEVLICPKGSFHPYEFYYDYYVKPFDDEGNWELSCYLHNTGYFLVVYAHNGNTAFYYVKGNNRDYKKLNSFTELYGYKLPEYENKGHNYEYKFPSLQKKGENLVFSGFNLIMNSGENSINTNQIQGITTIIKAKTDTQGSIDSDNYFYYFTYNNVSDFSSGYSNAKIDINSGSYANSFSITNNSDSSPLTFLDNVEIKEIKFVPGTKNIYYKIYNKDKDVTYFGIIDVKENKVIYNFEGDDDTIFIPDTTGNMLAITSTNMYRVCMVKSSDSDSCNDACTTLLLDPDGNKCQAACDSGKIKMMPEGICISSDYCDLNYYVLNEDGTECGLCNYFYPNGEKYKLINTTGCLSVIPNNTEYHNTQWNTLKCKKDYHRENYECIPDSCYESCETCYEVSNNATDQKCSSCKSGYTLEDGNCVVIPTTIITTIPKIPTTILKIPTTIPIIPTTILKIPTTIPIIPTTILKIPTTIPKIPTTIPKIPTTIPKIPTTIPKIPTTVIKIQTTIPFTIPKSNCEEKCLTCSEESTKLGLCLTCNEAAGYKKLNYTLVLSQFLNCIKPDDPKFINYYYNETLKVYRPCYKTCKRCLEAGDAGAHHCLECTNGYMLRPYNNPYNNCVVYSEYYYYISSYNQFKSLDVYQCPEEAKYYIQEKKSCLDDCKKDKDYKYLYNGNCIKECPAGTHNENYVCILDEDKCILGQNDIHLSEKDNLEVIGTLVKSYISEFNYTDKYISLKQNNDYSIVIYKDQNCISELNLELPEVNFQSCYTKVQNAYGITENLIIIIVDKRGVKIPSSFYSFYHPVSGRKLDAEEICKDDTIVVKASLTSILNKNDSNYAIQTSLTSQGINIFDINDPFYNDLCFDFDNPLDKDIPLNYRIQTIFPNVSLCDTGCQYKGINLEDMTSTCDCKFKDIANSDAIKDNAILDEAFGDVFDIINSSNILVFKCFKYIFKHFTRSIGGWISLGLILAHIAMTLVYLLFEAIKCSKYIYTLTKNYIYYISKKKKPLAPPRRSIKNGSLNEAILGSEKNKKKGKKQLQPILRANHGKDDFSVLFQGNTRLKISKYEEIEIDDKFSEKKSNKVNTKINKLNKVEKLETKAILKESKTEKEKINEKNKDDDLDDLNSIEYDKDFFEDYLKTDPDDMEFDDAVVKDKRKYCEHMKENLIEDQIILSTFVAEDKLKPRSIKIIIFILNVILYFVVNGLFFSEEVITELYNIDEDEENFFSFLPRSIERIIYSTIVSIVVSIITNFFFIEEKKIKGIFKRQKDDIPNLKQNIKQLMKDIKLRYIIFIIIVGVILIISMFYLLCFNYVYPYSQSEWIKSSIAIMIIMQILSLLKCILETSLRYLSMKFNSEKLYKISLILD